VTADCFILPHFLPARNQPAFLSHLIGSRGASHVLITHAMLGYRLLPYLRARHPQVTFVDYNHMVASDWPSGGYPGQGARAQTLLDLNIVSSDMVRRWMIAQGAEAARIAVSYTGVDTTIWDPGRFDRQGLRRQHGVHDQRPVLIFAGRLVAQKRPERFIEIVRGLKARGLGFEAWIVGDGPLTPKIERAIRHAGLQGTVRLLGTRPADEVPALLAAGDVLVLPSLNEGIALILFEAMALGLPVVSADVGGQRELVGPEAGILIAPNRGELEAYIDAVAGLLVDPARRAQMGAAARQRVASRFDLADTLTQMEGLLQRAAELAAAAPRQPPTPDEAERLAIDVIADLEYDRLQEQLRVPDATRAASGWRARLAHVVKLWVLRPAYYWGLRQGIPGLDQAATWAFERLRWLLG
jgi:glycosyltransferase involved in cell wall biosynthesis